MSNIGVELFIIPFEGQGSGVDAVSRLGRERAVLKDMAKVAFAGHAENLCPSHPIPRVFSFND